ncbi:eRF1 domain 1-domain-containing protein [Tribonema minus]|uniref:Protein pelota homolog n=1 Tax=Tribonema minus TaxID=303371 RepID=A0A835Z3B0_9STRA|nr:eRF1 domain 1-domain-containing protein [Tribonema minus]
MKVVAKHLEKDGAGYIKLQAEETEDMWHAYNLIAVGDRVRTTTVRKVVSESSTGSTSSKRVRLNLTIGVERTDFDSEGCVLRLSGKNVEENAHVKIGAYHTLDLELNQTFSVEKAHWDAMHLDRIDAASDPVRCADVAAVVMTAGLAHVCLVTAHMTVTRARVEMNIPRKRAGSSDHAKAIRRFYEAVYRAVLDKIDFAVVRCVLLGSPGFVKDDFFAYLCEEAVRREDRPLIENKAKFVLCHATSGHKHAVEELLSQPAVLARLADTKAAAEVRALAEFFAMLKADPDRAFYGYAHVARACADSAVDALLVTDGLFRARELATRRKYVALVEDAKEKGARVFVFSSMHVTGEQLGQLGGIAAVLRFPMPDIEEEDHGGGESSEEEGGEGGASRKRGGMLRGWHIESPR